MIEEVLARLDGVRHMGPGEAMAQCPSHDDPKASLSIKEADDGKVLLNCFAGCKTENVLAAAGLEWKDLFPDDENCGEIAGDEAADASGDAEQKPTTANEKAVLKLTKELFVEAPRGLPGVSAILRKQHGIKACPGARCKCPSCGAEGFSIRSDDTVGQCFNMNCRRRLVPALSSPGASLVLHRLHEEIFNQANKRLLLEPEMGSSRSYRYLVEDRKVHGRVLLHSLVGEIPAGFDVDATFQTEIDRCRVEIESGEPGIHPNGLSAADELAVLEYARDKLKNCLVSGGDRLAFFYTDSLHRIVAIRLRFPGTKRIVLYKPLPRQMGVFNHGLFDPEGRPALGSLASTLLVVEGEVNNLQMQSLCVDAVSQERGPEGCGYIPSCAVGGVTSADVATIRKICPSPTVCYDNDASRAGYGLVDAIRQSGDVTAFTTPDTGSDLDTYLRPFRDRRGMTAEGIKALEALLAGAAFLKRDFQSVVDELDDIRSREGGKGGLKKFEVHRLVGTKIIEDVARNSEFLFDGAVGYILPEDTRRLVAIDNGNIELKLLLNRYGIAPADDVARAAFNALGLHALEHGRRTQVHMLSHYAQAAATLYLSNQGGRVYRITPDTVDLVDNGTDGVLFIDPPTAEPFTLKARTDGGSVLGKFFDRIPWDAAGSARDDMALIFMFWFLSVFLPELFPTRPIVALVGERGSGKSSSLRMVGQILMGSGFNVMPLTDDSKDFDAAVTSQAFVAVDNADTNVRWFQDRLAVAATGGTIQKRVLYTTNGLAEFPFRAFLGVTSRTPHFRREDVADRLLVFPVRRLGEFMPEAQLLADVRGNRDLIMTEVVELLQNAVAVLASNRHMKIKAGMRMADFADFVIRYGGEDQRQALVAVVDRQNRFVVEGEPLFALLDDWLAMSGNPGREVETDTLRQELEDVAARRNIDFRYSTRSLGQRLSGLKSTLKDLYSMGERPIGGHRRVVWFRPLADKYRNRP